MLLINILVNKPDLFLGLKKVNITLLCLIVNMII